MATRKPPAAAWKPGQSGNPKGRPVGTGEVAKLRAAIAGNVPAILESLTTAALAGDVQAARLLLERALPPIKPVEATQALSLPDGTLTEQGRAVLAAVAAGELAPGQGAQLLTAIGTLGKVAEIDELAGRVAALEATHAKP
ncbi:DUF5681 domain-containing protein [Acidovorax sp.]|uniref:DUF5681 domain-containing protein n=1 Tax=Acidovorax sp. TaxID=1872122 RepID=UPI00258E25DA|nr:DUF5681 domain-containing protein [Acidovorax sp.]